MAKKSAAQKKFAVVAKRCGKIKGKVAKKACWRKAFKK